MRIVTASGHIIRADNDDDPILAGYSWYVNKTPAGRLYAQARVPGMGRKRVFMHRLLMEPPHGMVVHHKNNDGLDNRRSNLEVTTNRKNILYAREDKESGVHFHKQTGKWRAQLRDPGGKFVSLGLHATKEAAIEAANKFKTETRA